VPCTAHTPAGNIWSQVPGCGAWLGRDRVLGRATFNAIINDPATTAASKDPQLDAGMFLCRRRTAAKAKMRLNASQDHVGTSETMQETLRRSMGRRARRNWVATYLRRRAPWAAARGR